MFIRVDSRANFPLQNPTFGSPSVPLPRSNFQASSVNSVVKISPFRGSPTELPSHHITNPPMLFRSQGRTTWQAQPITEKPLRNFPAVNPAPSKHRLEMHRFPQRSRLDILSLQRQSNPLPPSVLRSARQKSTIPLTDPYGSRECGNGLSTDCSEENTGFRLFQIPEPPLSHLWKSVKSVDKNSWPPSVLCPRSSIT